MRQGGGVSWVLTLLIRATMGQRRGRTRWEGAPISPRLGTDALETNLFPLLPLFGTRNLSLFFFFWNSINVYLMNEW